MVSTLISGQGVAASNSATSSRLVSLSAGLLQGWRTLVLCRPSGLKRAMTHGIPQKLKVHRGDRDHHEQKRSRSDVLVVDPGISTVSTGARIGLFCVYVKCLLPPVNNHVVHLRCPCSH